MQKIFYKIPRDICLIKYRSLPLRAFDEKFEEVFYSPSIVGLYWLKNERENKKIIGDLVDFFKILKLDSFIFMCDENKPWISDFTSKRKDYKALKKALEYFKLGKVKTKFNGGILVFDADIRLFLTHFFTLIQCDGGFSYYYFIDDKNNFVFSLHYSGELQVMTLTKKADKLLHKILSETNFIDAVRANSDRIL